MAKEWHGILTTRSLFIIKNTSINKVLVGFTAGLLVGILFAPAKGSETRENIARRGNELKDKFNDLVDSVTDKFESLKADAEDMVDQGMRQAKSYQNEVS
ncbi:MAG: YtxH domain-containing protein [Chitinophagaceae bacterium]